MDPRVLKLKTPADCETFAKNAFARGHGELGREAIQRAVELRAELHGAGTLEEIECLKAVYAYERALRHKAESQYGLRAPGK